MQTQLHPDPANDLPLMAVLDKPFDAPYLFRTADRHDAHLGSRHAGRSRDTGCSCHPAKSVQRAASALSRTSSGEIQTRNVICAKLRDHHATLKRSSATDPGRTSSFSGWLP